MSESTGAVGTISQWRINGNIYDLKDKNLTKTLEDYSTSVQVDNKIAAALEGFSGGDGLEHEFVTDEANATDNEKIYFVYDNNASEESTFATTEYVDGQVEGLASITYVDNLVGQIASQLDEINGEEI